MTSLPSKENFNEKLKNFQNKVTELCTLMAKNNPKDIARSNSSWWEPPMLFSNNNLTKTNAKQFQETMLSHYRSVYEQLQLVEDCCKAALSEEVSEELYVYLDSIKEASQVAGAFVTEVTGGELKNSSGKLNRHLVIVRKVLSKDSQERKDIEKMETCFIQAVPQLLEIARESIELKKEYLSNHESLQVNIEKNNGKEVEGNPSSVLQSSSVAKVAEATREV